jgi:hypothetical protein
MAVIHELPSPFGHGRKITRFRMDQVAIAAILQQRQGPQCLDNPRAKVHFHATRIFAEVLGNSRKQAEASIGLQGSLEGQWAALSMAFSENRAPESVEVKDLLCPVRLPLRS